MMLKKINDLIHKQKLLEQELEKLRVQQQNVFSGHSNQLEPIFSEPDRSIVTKLAAIDPTQLLNHQNNHFPVVMNRFTSSDAIPAPKIQSNSREVSLTPSISYNPFIEAGKLPENAQILPTKPPTGFHSFVKFSSPLLQNNFPPSHLIPQNNDNNNRLLRQEVNFQQNFNANNNNLRLPSLNSQNNNNRFLRQEIPNNVNTFSIVPAQQPFPPKHEFSYFPIDINNNNNRFLRQNQNNEILQPPSQNFNQFFIPQQPQTLRFLPPQSIITFTQQQPQNNNLNNRFLRSNSDETVSQQNGLFQTYKYSNSFGFPSSLFNNLPLN